MHNFTPGDFRAILIGAAFGIFAFIGIGIWSVAIADDYYKCTKAHYDESRTRILLAFGMEVLELDKRGLLDFFIDDRFWHSMTFNEKQLFAQRISCAAAGTGKAISSFTLNSKMTGKPVGNYSWGTLTVQ